VRPRIRTILNTRYKPPRLRAWVKLNKMDTSIGENEPLTIQHCYWLGLKNENGALIRKGMKGEVQFYDGMFHYCEDNKAVKTLHICKDLNDIVIPIANAEIAERNRKRLG